MADSREIRQQAIFDRVWQHFIIEGNPFIDGDLVDAGPSPFSPAMRHAVREPRQTPRYRAPDGAMSVYGLFIDDAKYKPALEELLPANLFWEAAFIPYIGNDSTLLADLQNAHARREPDLEKRLRLVAGEWGFKVPS